jgi:murein DD-endopeptidase MepM/ murein hydrolase activator NlpD
MRRLPVATVVLLCACAAGPPAAALAASGGASPGTGTSTTTSSAPSSHSGGAGVGAGVPGPRPTAPLFHLNPSTITLGQKVPRLSVRIVQPASRTVKASVRITPPKGATVTLSLGTVRTGKVARFALPKKLPIRAGTYTLRLSVTDHVGQTLATSRKATGHASLRIKAKPKAPVVKEIKPDPTPPKAVTPVKKKPATKKTKTITVSFPVAGPHSFGGAGGRFGVGRVGHRHQGQDVPAAEGTPVVAPSAGEITATGYQAAAAGYWVAMHTPGGRDFFFAHCEKGSTVVRSGQTVHHGTRLCRVGQTGDATGPHLHFEIWLDGWRTSSASHPIDPLPQLERWQAADPRW